MAKDYAVSPHYSRNQFANPYTDDDRITIYDDRVKGWQLDIAKTLIDSVGHSGYAVMQILLSYFEMVGQYLNGKSSEGASKKTFRDGFEAVFGKGTWSEAQMNDLYERGRCALYHSATGKKGFLLDARYKPLEYVGDDIQANPHTLPGVLRAHHDGYVARLRKKDPAMFANFLAMDKQLIED